MHWPHPTHASVEALCTYRARQEHIFACFRSAYPGTFFVGRPSPLLSNDEQSKEKDALFKGKCRRGRMEEKGVAGRKEIWIARSQARRRTAFRCLDDMKCAEEGRQTSKGAFPAGWICRFSSFFDPPALFASNGTLIGCSRRTLDRCFLFPTPYVCVPFAFTRVSRNALH